MITVGNAQAKWEPLAGPVAGRHYAESLRWNRRLVSAVPLAIVAGIVALKVGGIHAASFIYVAIIVWGAICTVASFRERRQFRKQAQVFLRVTPEERQSFACGTPDVLATWIRQHRPAA